MLQLVSNITPSIFSYLIIKKEGIFNLNYLFQKEGFHYLRVIALRISSKHPLIVTNNAETIEWVSIEYIYGQIPMKVKRHQRIGYYILSIYYLNYFACLVVKVNR